MSQQCECHKIDWFSPLKNGGICIYRYKPEYGGGVHEQCRGPTAMPCQDKLNLGTMTCDELENTCKYIVGDHDKGSLFPKEVWEFLRNGDDEGYNPKYDENSSEYYKLNPEEGVPPENKT